MTGRDLILYILQNNLENEPVFKDGRFIGFFTVGEVAERLHVGVPTVLAWQALGKIECIPVRDMIYIPANSKKLTEQNPE